MPRAFLITHRRYNEKEVETRGENLHLDTSNDVLLESENSSDCPDELYNLTKLAEVSLAAAAGKILDHKHLSTKPHECIEEPAFTYTHKLFDKSSRAARPHLIKKDNVLTSSNTNIPSKVQNYQEEIDKNNLNENNEHKCDECDKRYSTSSNLARHRQTHRSPADKKARRCPHCDKLYVSMPAYSMHVRTHNQGCKCQYCGKCFSRPWLLQGHIRTHTGEKPFKCSICNKAFADKSNLRAHVQTHSNTKPHVCGRCGKAFALKSYLYKHEESSCMRINGRHNSRDVTPDKSMSSPTPVIVSMNSVIKTTENYSVRSPIFYRSTVISPNPERILYSTIEHPSVILSAGRIAANLQEQPVDFSASRNARGFDDKIIREHDRSGGYSVGFPIAV